MLKYSAPPKGTVQVIGPQLGGVTGERQCSHNSGAYTRIHAAVRTTLGKEALGTVQQGSGQSACVVPKVSIRRETTETHPSFQLFA